ncbi:MAG: type II toxin-antitoxin system Phd/YefM family antitoxin [Pseudomonadota bacterium]
MTKTMSITEARKALMDLPDEMENKDLDAIEVTRWGRKVLAIVPWEEYESIAETKEILKDKVAMKGIRSGLKEAGQGKARDVAAVRKRLGL